MTLRVYTELYPRFYKWLTITPAYTRWGHQSLALCCLRDRGAFNIGTCRVCLFTVSRPSSAVNFIIAGEHCGDTPDNTARGGASQHTYHLLCHRPIKKSFTQAVPCKPLYCPVRVTLIYLFLFFANILCRKIRFTDYNGETCDVLIIIGCVHGKRKTPKVLGFHDASGLCRISN